jgi:ubiquinone biosynthesis protein UbiJ
MSEDLTRDLPEQTFQERVLSEFAAMRGEIAAVRSDIAALDTRLTTLEEKVDRRLQETRPIWESIQEQLRKLDGKFGIVLKEFYEVRYDIAALGKRVEQLETPAQP